jgi:hypothetical protein
MLKIVILIALAIIIGLFKNYYVIIGSIITVTLFLSLKKGKHTLTLILIFGSSIVISTLVSEFTKIQLLHFPPLEKKKLIQFIRIIQKENITDLILKILTI